MTQVNKTQVKDLAVYDHHVAIDAAIAWPKISKVGAIPPDIGAEWSLTFMSPLLRVDNSISIDITGLLTQITPITVDIGGTGLTSVPEGEVVFGGTATALASSNLFKYDAANENLSLDGLKMATSRATNLVDIQNYGGGLDLMSYKDLGVVNLSFYASVDMGGTFNEVLRLANIFAPSNGYIILADNTGLDFNGLYFGTNSVGNPSLIVNGPELDVKLGDNSAFTDINVKSVKLNEVDGGITFTDASIQTTAAVPLNRRVDTTGPLQGGGDLTADLTLSIDQFTDVAAGIVPPSGGGTIAFLRADGTWVDILGASGYSGYSGYSGESNISGYSGYSGIDGILGGSGYSGYSGYSGESNISGYSGYSGAQVSGYSGYSGSGVSGYSGYSGLGLSGYSGYSGAVGATGVSGYSGYSGKLPISGTSGYLAKFTAPDVIADSPVYTDGTNVSVGTTSLGYKLRVNGTSLISGVLYNGAGVVETKVAMAANNIDLSLGTVFTKTVTGTTAFTLSNVAGSGNVSSFLLELTNGGAYSVTWFSGIKWHLGIPPTLTASGVDIFGFYTYDGGTTWRGVFMAKDSK